MTRQIVVVRLVALTRRDKQPLQYNVTRLCNDHSITQGNFNICLNTKGE